MKSFGKYISRYLASFMGLVLILLAINAVAFCWTFYGIMTKDYGDLSPQNMLDITAASASLETISDEASERLRNNHIWAVYLDMEGSMTWGVDMPVEIPGHFTIQDVALFAKGYLADYPVFIRNTDDGMLILGYPKDSYTKLTGNYFSIRSIKAMPFFLMGILAADLAILFLAYFFSKRKILRSTEPIITSIEELGNGKATALSVQGELSGIANSVNKASHILSRQHQARANWISGVSHDIRTPLSMIMGYAEQIANEKNVEKSVCRKAEIIKQQSIKIKELVLDLNLVSQLEYEMQPIHKQAVRLAGLLRSYTAELLNTGLPDAYSVEIAVAPAAETIVFDCDARLISRAIGNLVQNSIRHNPKGCDIAISLNCTTDIICLSVSDNGVGLSAEKIKELKERPHYMESTDDRLDLRHGLGLILVHQIAKAHNGSMEFDCEEHKGFKVNLIFEICQVPINDQNARKLLSGFR
ncbi:MAG: HAMP domain-containing histidine kinase [Lachnospiraceae bacterium]|nr:HAMP domain-containing histidine kinase [Lachnospiraceae bacterium]